jgi:multidrug transporter EmrE-like cation transporter
MLHVIPLGFASIMALIDTAVLSWFKSYHIGTLTWRGIVPFGMLLYALQPLIFLQSLNYENMTIMNILWDVISDIFVTTMGLFYFKEKLSPIKMAGLSFAFIAIVLLSYDEIRN